MSGSQRFTAKVSSNGGITLPKQIRDQRNWGPHVELIVEEVGDGVLLRAVPAFEPTTIDQVFGALKRPDRER